MKRNQVTFQNSISKNKDMEKSMYSKLVKCDFGYHTPINRICKGRELESRMYKTKYGLICVCCYKIVETKGKKAKQALMMLK